MSSSHGRRLTACAAALLLAACGPSTEMPVEAPAKAADDECVPMGGPGAVVSTSASLTCIGCAAVQPELAGDGDPATAARVVVGANSNAGFSLRVTTPGMTHEAGSRAGIMTGVARAVGPGDFLVRTYLEGTLQDEAEAPSLNEDPPFTIETTKPFDAVEIVFDSASTTAGATYDVAELCTGLGGAERSFRPADNGQNWTRQNPGPYTTTEMRDWFKTLEAAADSGATVTLPVSYFAGVVVGPVLTPTDQFLNVVLERSKMLDDSTFFQINTIDYTGPFLRVYEGRVVDRPDSLVHLTLADDFIRGVARIDDDIFLVRIGTEGNLPAALVRGGDPSYAWQQPQSGDPVGCPEDHIPNNNQNLPLTNDVRRLIPPYVSPEYLLSPGQAPELEARIILDADVEAYKDWGWHLPALMVAMHAEQAVTYRHQVGVRFRIAGVHLNTLEGYYPAPLHQTDAFGAMAAWWGSYMADRRDIVHLLTGQSVPTLKSSCIGGAGSPAGYFFTSTHIDTEKATFRHMNIMSHEIGHLFSAHHHYGNHVEYPGSATIMIQGYTPGDLPVFGSLERGVIRGWAEHFLSPSAD